MKFNFLLLTFLIIAFVSCGKKDENSPKRQIKLLIKVVKKYSDRNDSTIVAYNYDKKNRILSIISPTTARGFSYDGDDLVRINDRIGDVGPLWTFSYINNVISRANYYSNEQPVVNHMYDYLITNGKVIKRVGPAQFTYTLSYLGNNITSWTTTSGVTTTYQYGTNKNPFRVPGYKYALIIPDLEGDDLFSENNVTTITTQQAPFLGANYSYVFSPDGYPSSATVRSTVGNDPNAFTLTYLTYYYKLFDVIE